MNICIFGAASSKIDEKYTNAAFELGKVLAQNGHRLVFGGGSEGMMGASARGFHEGGGHITGIIPEFFKEGSFDTYEPLYTQCDEVIYTEDIASRIKLMEEMSDAFIVVPGGIGTYEEFFKILVSRSLNRHKKPLVIANIDGFFDPLVDMILQGIEKKFIAADGINQFRMIDMESPEDVAGCFTAIHINALLK